MNTAQDFLSLETLKHLVPSAFAEKPAETVSSKYKFIPSTEVIDVMEVNGLLPVRAQETPCKVPETIGVQKHMITFRSKDATPNDDGLYPELVMVNSHNARVSFRLFAGIFRFVCSNGIIIGAKTAEIRTRHLNIDHGELMNQIDELTGMQDMIFGKVEAMKGINLSNDRRKDLCVKAIEIRYNGKPAPFNDPTQLLQVRRDEDGGTDLWTTFNRVQENICRGGMGGKNKLGHNTMTKAITGVKQTIDFNRKFWDLTTDQYSLN